jgi:oligopeptide/dipeptide ABC transporter ATP-binding protein
MRDDGGLVVEDLRVSFDGGTVPVIRDLSLRIPAGEALGLVGESGSGKSLTARAILGLLPRGAQVTGRIVLDGKSLLDLSPTARDRMRGSRIGMIFQDPMSSLNPVLRVGDAIAQVIRSHEDVDRKTAKFRTIELLQRVGLNDAHRRFSAYPHQFSGGMRQRIMIAMALAANPGLLLADEPTTALDVVVQAGILRLINGLRRSRKMSLLFVSHDLAVVSRMCDRIAVMYAGSIVEEGPTMQVLHRPRMPYTIGLLNSIPGPRSGSRLAAISGFPPQLETLPQGCTFAPRCRMAIEACSQSAVAMVEVEAGHWARCLRTLETGGSWTAGTSAETNASLSAHSHA